jgi:hypothetical protein
MARSNPSQENESLLLPLPHLPDVIEYYDDFAEVRRSLAVSADPVSWRLEFDGRICRLWFCDWSPRLRPLIVHWCAYLLSTKSPRTTEFYFASLNRVTEEMISEMILASPTTIRAA